MTYDGMFDEVDCKFELKRAKKYIKKQSDIIIKWLVYLSVAESGQISTHPNI